MQYKIYIWIKKQYYCYYVSFYFIINRLYSSPPGQCSSTKYNFLSVWNVDIIFIMNGCENYQNNQLCTEDSNDRYVNMFCTLFCFSSNFFFNTFIAYIFSVAVYRTRIILPKHPLPITRRSVKSSIVYYFFSDIMLFCYYVLWLLLIII